MKQKLINIFNLTTIATGFTIAQGLLSLLIVYNQQFYESISYHYSDSFIWYFIFYIVPILAGFTFFFALKNKNLTKGFRILFGTILIFQLAFTLTAAIMNNHYWGYPFKRPAVFKEIHSANTVITCSPVSNIDSSGISSLHLIRDTNRSLKYNEGKDKFYYGILDRVFMVFNDKATIYSNLYNFPEIYKNPKSKASNKLLKNINQQITESKIIDLGINSKTTPQLTGLVTEFVTHDNYKYIFVGLNGGEVSNDHYSHYEFLFIEKDNQPILLKQQRFYTDIAGIEGLEYANIAPLFSLLLSVIGFIVSIFLKETNGFVSRKK